IKWLQTPESVVCLEVVDALGRALPVSDLKERQVITEALTKISPKATIPVLIKLLQHSERSHRQVMANALAKIAAETAISTLIEMLRTSGWDDRRDIAQDLARIAEGLQENGSINPRPLVKNIFEALQETEKQYIGQVKQEVIHVLDTIENGYLLNRLQLWIGQHQVQLIGVIIYIVGLPSLWLLCLVLRPLLLISLDESLIHFSLNVKLKLIDLPIRYFL